MPNIELVLPEGAVNSLAASFYRRGNSPIESAVYVSSRPFLFDGDASADQFTVRNIVTGEITTHYSGATIEVRIVKNEVIYFMDNGDILNISLAMRSIGKGVFERMLELQRSEAN